MLLSELVNFAPPQKCAKTLRHEGLIARQKTKGNPMGFLISPELIGPRIFLEVFLGT